MVSSDGLVLGVDIGTSGCKAAVYDSTGALHGTGYERYELMRPSPMIVEQDPGVWWRACAVATRQALSTCDPTRVLAMATSSTNALVALDTAGRPVRPAIMQLDRRAEQEAAEQRSILDPDLLLARTGNAATAGPNWLPTIAWLQRNEPATMRTVGTFLYPGGWVVERLTGVESVDTSRASTSLLLDVRTGDWCPDLAEVVGIDVGTLPSIYEATAVVGHLQTRPAAELGLQPGLLVAAGSMDSAAAALGAGVSSPGRSLIVLGTTARYMTLSREYRPRDHIVTCPFPGESLWLSMAVIWNAGLRIRDAASQWTGRPEYSRLERLLTSLAADPLSSVAVEAEAASETDSRAAATIRGVVRELVDHAATLHQSTSADTPCVAAVGGGSRSAALVALIGASLSVGVTRPDAPDTEPLGAAIIAAVAAGLFPSIGSAVSSMTRPGLLIYSPDRTPTYL